jgi:hypothetical protein
MLVTLWTNVDTARWQIGSLEQQLNALRNMIDYTG